MHTFDMEVMCNIDDFLELQTVPVTPFCYFYAFYPSLESSGPEKSGHVVYGAILFIAGKITGCCTLACNKGLKMDLICTTRYK